MHARYDYDPWGRRITVSGDLDPDVGFTGHYQHTPSGLGLAPFRASDPNVGRWINEDPSGLAGGPNRFAYVDGNPVTMYDPTGDDATTVNSPSLAVSRPVLLPVSRPRRGSCPVALGVALLAVVAIAADLHSQYMKSKKDQDDATRRERFNKSLTPPDRNT